MSTEDQDSYKLFHANLGRLPTRDVECINCSKLVKTMTTYAPGPLACCLGTTAFLTGYDLKLVILVIFVANMKLFHFFLTIRCWCMVLVACSYWQWLSVKHYCPYCGYYIGDYKSNGKVVMNLEAVENVENPKSSDKAEKLAKLKEKVFKGIKVKSAGPI